MLILAKSDVDHISEPLVSNSANNDIILTFFLSIILQVKRPRTDNDTDALSAARYVQFELKTNQCSFHRKMTILQRHFFPVYFNGLVLNVTKTIINEMEAPSQSQPTIERDA